MKLFASMLAACAVLLSQQTLAAEPLTATLEAHKVVRGDDGTERFAAASEAAPGDVLEYRVTYTNISEDTLNDVTATLPVPTTGVEYLAATAHPAPVEASTSGTRFAPTPLKRVVRLPDGKYQQQLVPASEYRFLRWPLGELSPGASKTVSARMRVTTAPIRDMT